MNIRQTALMVQYNAGNYARTASSRSMWMMKRLGDFVESPVWCDEWERHITAYPKNTLLEACSLLEFLVGFGLVHVAERDGPRRLYVVNIRGYKSLGKHLDLT